MQDIENNSDVFRQTRLFEIVRVHQGCKFHGKGGTLAQNYFDLHPPGESMDGPVIMQESLVYIVEDDFRMREAMEELLTAAGIPCVAFGTALEFLTWEKPDIPSCLLLDIELPDVNGLDLQRQLSGIGHPPIVFITGYGDISKSVSAMKAGAIDFLPKPVGGKELIAALHKAFLEDHKRRIQLKALETLRDRYESLTMRERDVFPLVVSGLLNKQAAGVLGISEVTYQIHRGKVMRKMEARSFAELVRMADKLGVPYSESV